MYDLDITNPDKKATLLGLTSMGTSGELGMPAIYARVDRILDWIVQMNTTYFG